MDDIQLVQVLHLQPTPCQVHLHGFQLRLGVTPFALHLLQVAGIGLQGVEHAHGILVLHAGLLRRGPRAQPPPRRALGRCTTRRHSRQRQSRAQVAARPRHSPGAREIQARAGNARPALTRPCPRPISAARGPLCTNRNRRLPPSRPVRGRTPGARRRLPGASEGAPRPRGLSFKGICTPFVPTLRRTLPHVPE